MPQQLKHESRKVSELMERVVGDRPQTVRQCGFAVAPVVAVATDEAAINRPANEGFVDYLLSSPRVDSFELPVRRSVKAPPLLSR